MNFTIDEVLNEAIMSRTPAILVEGINDIKIYTHIAESAQRDVEIYAIETIDGFSEGCAQVVDAVRELYELPGITVEDHIIGIIDRDVREFRNEIPAEKAFLVLDLYSIESHFATREVFENAVSQYTLMGSSVLGTQFIDDIFMEIEDKLLDLHYISLESLKLALNEGYAADFQYSFNHNRRKQLMVKDAVSAKMADLDSFANSLGIKKDSTWIRKIACGKWLLRTFSEEIYSILQNFSTRCGTKDTEQCQFCKRNIAGKCTYKLKDGVNNRTIYSLAFENFNIQNLDYIRNRISALPLAIN